MWNKLLLVMLVLAGTAYGQQASPQRVDILARAIARAEGFGRKGTLPTRCHNAGDIKALKNYRFPGQVGILKQYVVFKNDKTGWEALQHQINKIVAGESRYTVNLTLKQLGKRYAESGIWPRVVAKYLRTTPDTTLWEVLDVPPYIDWREQTCLSINAALPVAPSSVPTFTTAGSTASTTGGKPWGNPRQHRVN